MCWMAGVAAHDTAVVGVLAQYTVADTTYSGIYNIPFNRFYTASADTGTVCPVVTGLRRLDAQQARAAADLVRIINLHFDTNTADSAVLFDVCMQYCAGSSHVSLAVVQFIVRWMQWQRPLSLDWRATDEAPPDASEYELLSIVDEWGDKENAAVQ